MNTIPKAIIVVIMLCLAACGGKKSAVIKRPKEVWALRSVLDKHPRMLTLALDSSCYAAYDLAHGNIYKVWKGGISLEGAAFTNKKNIQPVSWGTPYSDHLHNQWSAEFNGKKDSIHIISKGYRFKDNQVYLQFILLLSNGDTIGISERPEFIRSEDGRPGLERLFTLTGTPKGVTVSLKSADNIFRLGPDSTSRLTTYFNELPAQVVPEEAANFDHMGRYYMEKSDCFTCHELDKNTVGPALIRIAQRYQDEENPASHLVSKVRDGGSGVWGNTPMTAHPGLSEKEIRTMLDYILTLKPAVNESPVKIDKDKIIPALVKSKPGFGAPLAGVHPSYTLQTIHDDHFKPRVGGLAFMPDGRLLVTTWDSIGAVYALDGVETGDAAKIKVKRIASGLAEPLGIEVVNGEIYVLQKQELTKLTDLDGDGIIDEYQAVCNSWGVTGDFHEFAFGLVYKDGYFYATLSMAMRLMSNEKELPDRGKTIKISKDGSFEWINYGLRTPNGIGLGVDNELFVTDNQGEWVPANKLIHVKKGEYHGMRWGFLDSLHEPPRIAMPAIWLPEDEIGNSPTEPVLCPYGPFKGQMLHGDVTHGGIQRDFLEKINGDYQGAVFRFTQGLEAGVNRLRWGPDSALYIGGIGMTGGWSWKEKQYGLQRLKYNGKPAFEMLAIRAKPRGFEIAFTEPVSAEKEIKAADFFIQQWHYLATSGYGGPKLDLEKMIIKGIHFSKDRTRILLDIPGLKKEHVVYFRIPDELKSASGESLWSSESWYTLNNIPEQ